MEITKGIILEETFYDKTDKYSLECVPVRGGEALKKHFQANEKESDINVNSEDIFVKTNTGKTVEVSADISGLNYKYKD